MIFNTVLVCICKGVSERKLQDVIAAGAESVESVGRACGAGTDCGTCQGSIEELITEHRLTRAADLANIPRQRNGLRAPCGSSQPEPSHEGQRSGH
jgi:bacterioferritin-associated ferredoxin